MKNFSCNFLFSCTDKLLFVFQKVKEECICTCSYWSRLSGCNYPEKMGSGIFRVPHNGDFYSLPPSLWQPNIDFEHFKRLISVWHISDSLISMRRV